MKSLKKLLAYILVLTMVFGMIPDSGYEVFAEDNVEVSEETTENSEDSSGDDGVITRAEWLKKLVTVFNMTVEDDNYPDNYFSDLSKESEYYYDFLLAVQFGLVSCEAGGPVYPDEAVTREFAAQTLNFCLGYQLEDATTYTFTDSAECSDAYGAQVAVNLGWIELVDGKFLPKQNITVNEYNKMITSAEEAIALTVVDENHENQYELAENVIEVPNGTLVERVDTENIWIYNSPVEIKAGDTFVAYFDGLANAYVAKEVSVTEEYTAIKVEAADNGTAFESIDAEGVITADFTQIETEEGVEIVFADEETGVTWANARDAQRAKTSKKVLKVEKTFDIGSGISSKIVVEIKNPKIEYNFDSKDTSGVYCKLVGETSISAEVEGNLVDAVGLDDITLFYWGVPGVGGFKVTLDLKAEAVLKCVTTGNLNVGVAYTKACGIRIIKDFSVSSFTIESEATLQCGIKASFGINDVPKDIIYGYVYVSAGGRIKISSTGYNDSQLPSKCTHFTAYLYAEYGASGGIKFGTTHISFSETKEIFDEYNSPVRVVKHYEDNVLKAECTRGIDWDSKFGRFYTKGNSRYGGSGWSKGNNSYGLSATGEPYAIFDYTLNENEEATITKYYGNMRAVVIPEELDGYKVKKIEYGVFAGNQYITSVNIPDSVEVIEDSVFEGCTMLSSVELSESLKEMGDHVFRNCVSLKSVEIPKSLTDVGFCPFCGSGLKYIRFEDGITKIPYNLFEDCDSLMEINIPDTVLTIDGDVFEKCDSLRVVNIPDSVSFIGNNAFGSCISLEEIIIPDSVKTIESYAFNGCVSLRDIKLSKKLEVIGEYVFYGCDALTDIEIPKSLKEVDGFGGNGPFANDSALKNVTFEEGITEIPGSLFKNCVSLEKIEIPDTVLTIGDWAFEGCTALKDVKLSDNVTYIGHSAFGNCDALEKIVIPDSVTEMSSYVFNDCLKLSEVTLSKNLTDVGNHVLGNCDALTTITIPKSLKTVNNGGDLYGAFEGCDNLKDIKFEEGITSIPNCLFIRCSGLEKIEIPDTVEIINYRAFYGASNLKEVIIPESVTTICDNAFAECDALEKIVIPDSVTTIEYEAFNNCDKLTDVTLPANLTRLSDNIFANSKGLQNITIPDSVTVIESGAFYNCTALERIVLPENLKTIENGVFRNCESLEDITLPDGLETISYDVFNNCDALTKIVIPDSVTELGHRAFMDCLNLNDVTLGTGLTVLPYECFANSGALESITLPYSITEIQYNAFKESPKLSNIFIPRAVTAIGNNVFSYPSKLTISGVAGTYAETYANENSIKFENKEVNATDVTIGEKEITVNRGEKFKLPLTVTPADFTDEITWRSTDTDVISIGENGELQARTAGTATVKVTVGNVSATCKITVVNPVSSVHLNSRSVTLDAFGSFQLTAEVWPEDALDSSVTWTSSDEKIATVDDNGFVKAVGKGTATITVTSNADTNIKAACEVTVNNNGYVVTDLSEFESPHNYENNCNDIWMYTDEKASSLTLTFNSKTYIEEGFDYLYIIDGADKIVGQFTGSELAGKTITSAGNTVKIQIVSDEAGNEWGFKVDSVVADTSGTPDIPDIPSCSHIFDNYVYDNNATTEHNGTKTAHCYNGCGAIDVVEAEGTQIVLEDVKDVVVAPPVMDEETSDMIMDSMNNAENEEVKAVTDEYMAKNPDAEITTDSMVIPVEEENASEETMKDIADLNSYMDVNQLVNAAYFDIQVVIKADGKVLGNVFKTDEAMTFIFAIPEELKAQGRTFMVLRIHNGEVTALDATVVDGNYAITTDSFSTYAVVYEDKEKSDLKMGDLDGDTFVTASDALLILKKAAALISLSEKQTSVADMNSDGFIDATDALTVLKIAAGLI